MLLDGHCSVFLELKSAVWSPLKPVILTTDIHSPGALNCNLLIVHINLVLSTSSL